MLIPWAFLVQALKPALDRGEDLIVNLCGNSRATFLDNPKDETMRRMYKDLNTYVVESHFPDEIRAKQQHTRGY